MPEPHRVDLAPAAVRQLDRLRGPALVALRGVILSLAADPRPAGSRKLTGTQDLWRIRIRVDGEPWRVVYQVRDGERLVVVFRVARQDEGAPRRSSQPRAGSHARIRSSGPNVRTSPRSDPKPLRDTATRGVSGPAPGTPPRG